MAAGGAENPRQKRSTSAVRHARHLDAELTPDLRDRMVAGCEDEAGARSVADLIAERDDGLIRIMGALAESRRRGSGC